MADLPNALTTINDEAGALAGGTGYCVVMSCVEKNADVTARVYASTRALIAQHGYSPGVDYAANHLNDTRKPVIFIGVPTATAGSIGRQNATGVTGTSVVSAAAAPTGVLDECDASVIVVTGGTVGTNVITFNLSMDGGVTRKLIRLGTATSYTIPYLGIVLNFGAGTLVAGDTYTFSTTAPRWDATGLNAARLALVAQTRLARSWMVIGDLAAAVDATAITTQTNTYETANARFVYARAQLRDQLPLASKSRIPKNMTGAPSLTFTATTITRSAGSFITDGFAVGDVVTVGGTASNNGSRGPITALTATVLTVAAGLVAEGPIGTATITGSEGLIFTTTTCTRSAGSWLADGFRVGDSVTTSGTVSNNGTKVITALTPTVLTYASGGVAEVIGSALVTMTKGETVSAYVALMDSTFSTIDGQRRIDIGIGRLRKMSPITGWSMRRPVQWAASIREYQHDVHIPCWAKAQGPLDGFSMLDASGTIAEFDDRVIGGAAQARFTAARTWGNGPSGAFISLSQTRATEGSALSRTHNMAVANLACTTVQASAEMVVGQVLQLNPDGTATTASLNVIEESINTDLNVALLQPGLEGPRASRAVWRASTTDILSVPGNPLTGVLTLVLNGTVEQIQTTVKVS
jgi:hypothetical protein